jgi:hypothetical protein
MDIQQPLSVAIQFFERNGWYLVGLGVIWYMIKDTVYDKWAEHERNTALKIARDPNRVSILEVERRKARELQQQQAEMEAKAARERMKQEKAERVRKEEEKTSKPSGNPLDGHRGGGSYSAPKRVVKRGGG